MKQSIVTSEEMMNIRNVDRLLPSQKFLSKYWGGPQQEFFPRLEQLMQSVLPVTTLEEKWDIILKPGVTYASLGSELNTLFFYQLLIGIGGIKRVLELGTYIGVSTLFLADAVGKDGKVTTVEIGEEFHRIAKENFKRNGLEDRIEVICGGASATLAALGKDNVTYDMIFMDAAKEQYGDMLEPALACLNPGGLLIVDDIFMQGDAFNSTPTLEKTPGVHELLKKIRGLADIVHTVILPVGNGMLLSHKKGE